MLKKLFLILFSIASLNAGICQTVNYAEYKKKYPEKDFVILESKSEIKYFIEPNTSKLKAKLFFTETILQLQDKSTKIDLIQIPFSSYEDVTITSAKYFKIDSLNKKNLVENIKVKFAET